MNSRGVGDESPEISNNAPADLNLRRLARDLEQELGGLFGINYRDVEKALERLRAGRTEARMALPVESAVRLLEALLEIARETAERDDKSSFDAILELVENYRKRLHRLREEIP